MNKNTQCSKDVNSLKLFIGLMQFLSKFPQNLFVHVDKLILKFIPKCSGHGIAETILTKKKAQGIILPSIKSHQVSTVIKTL